MKNFFHKVQYLIAKHYHRFMVWCVAIAWLMIVFKFFNIGFMRDLPWKTVTFPLFMFILTSLSYIIINYAYAKIVITYTKKATHKEKRVAQRQLELARGDTSAKRGLRAAIITLIAAIVAYLILGGPSDGVKPKENDSKPFPIELLIIQSIL